VSREGRTRRGAVVAAAVAVAGLGATAGSVAIGSQSARESSKNAKPVARLTPRHVRVHVGEKVLLDSSRSRDRDGRIVYHLWDLDGDGVFERSTGRHARLRHAFKTAGVVRVGVAVIDDDGGYAVRRTRLKAVVAEAPAASAPASTSENGAASRARVRTRTRDNGRHRARVRRAKTSSTAKTAPTVTAAASTTVVIKDYDFTPTSVTVNEGDTVTWRNDGPTTHTATSDEGTFDTGPLAKGSTGQYRFDKAGTYAYHCTPHPQMKATVVVKAANGNDSDSGGSSPGGSDSGDSSGDGSGSGDSNLPHTGLQIAGLVIAGLALLAAGTALRRRLAGS
jgi:plastocyanin